MCSVARSIDDHYLFISKCHNFHWTLIVQIYQKNHKSQWSHLQCIHQLIHRTIKCQYCTFINSSDLGEQVHLVSESETHYAHTNIHTKLKNFIAYDRWLDINYINSKFFKQICEIRKQYELQATALNKYLELTIWKLL